MGSGSLLQALALATLFAPAPFALADKLTIKGISEGERVVVLMHGRTKPGERGCGPLKVSRSTGELPLGNMLAGCGPWVAILSSNHAMALASPGWTDRPADEPSVTLERVIEVPVRVWLARPGTLPEAMDHMANANLLFEENKVGVEFKPRFDPVPADRAAAIEQGIRIRKEPGEDGTFTCQNLRKVERSGFYTPGMLNVYYIDQAITGRNCAITRGGGNANINFIGTAANRATLAHEFGHAFGLRPGDDGGHVGELEDFGTGNIMNDGGTGRRRLFSAGQVFRMNTYDDDRHGSMLVKNGPRKRPTRNCAPLTTNANCPALKIDWDRP